MIGKQIVRLLEPICPKKIFLAEASKGTTSPYICYTPISATYDDVMDGQSDYQQLSFQIDVYSKRQIEAFELVNKAYEQLKTLGISQVTRRFDYESDTQLYRQTLEFFY